MNSKYLLGLVPALALGVMMSFSERVSSEETKLEKAETVKNKTVDVVKKKYRNLKDKTCTMVNGKMECVEKEIKNKVQNAVDEIDTKAKEEKNKID